MADMSTHPAAPLCLFHLEMERTVLWQDFAGSVWFLQKAKVLGLGLGQVLASTVRPCNPNGTPRSHIQPHPQIWESCWQWDIGSVWQRCHKSTQ